MDPSLNPFVTERPRRNGISWARVLVLGPVLVPLRLGLFASAMAVLLLGGSISVAGLGRGGRDKPLRGWRTWFGKYVAPWACRAILFSLGFHRITVRGAPSKLAGIVVANHSTFTDPILMNCFSAGCFVANHKVAEYPLLGPVFRALQCIFVNRLDPDSRKKVAATIAERAEHPDIWPRVMLFPEGTCTNNRALISFKTGAFAPGKPVQPVCIYYPNTGCDLSYVQGTTIPKLMLRAMCQLSNSVEINFLPVYAPNAAERADQLTYARNVRRRMAVALGFPTTEHSYDDVQLQGEAHRLHMPFTEVVVEMGHFKSLFNLDVKEVKELLHKFHAMDSNNDGHLNYQEFAEALGLPPSPFAEQLFELLDENDQGEINFRQFVAGLSFISHNLTTEERLHAAWHVFDKDGDGFVHEPELAEMLMRVFVTMSREDVTALFRRVDADRDNRVTFQEFEAFVRKNPEYLLMLEFQQHPDDPQRSTPFLKRTLHEMSEHARTAKPKGH